jgi:dinuclear metal center YbgI/SA1388 family protein
MPVTVPQLDAYLQTLLRPGGFTDYCPNGLQLEGKPQIRKLVTGVTASLALIEAAAKAEADALLVHHGWFWRGEDPRLVGAKGRRVGALMAHRISLFAYHVPLDAHAEFGNNAQLGLRLGLKTASRVGDQDLVWIGHTPLRFTLRLFSLHIARRVGRVPLSIGEPERSVNRVAWCTGGAQGFFADAIAAGVDAFVTGEISERHTHMARESGVAFIAAGHHATERFGVQALGAHVANQFGVEHEYIDIPNPV